MKRHAPAAARNCGPIGDVLAGELPERGLVLEIASGTGEHAIAFAQRFTALEWLPSDQDSAALVSISAWREECQAGNLHPPILIDAMAAEYPVDAVDALLCINMVHISPWGATEGLFAMAEALLPAQGPLILYGPFLESDVETVQSNRDFDRSLRDRDVSWGIRQIEAVDELAQCRGFVRTARYAMPANNLTLVYRRD